MNFKIDFAFRIALSVCGSVGVALLTLAATGMGADGPGRAAVGAFLVVLAICMWGTIYGG